MGPVRRLLRSPSFFFFASASALVVLLYAPQVSSYFFLDDDYALIDIARRHGVTELFSRVFIGFFRPMTLLLLKPQTALWGWTNPGGYAAVSILIHLANALGVVRLAVLSGLTRRVAYLAGTLFLLSPWAAETFTWVSAQFELFAASGVIWGLVLVLAWEQNSGASNWYVALGFTLALAGLFSKEMAVVLPVFYLAFASAARRARPRRVSGWIFIALVDLDLLYLFARSRVMPVFGGAYGDVIELTRQTDLWSAGLRYLRSFLVIHFEATALRPLSFLFTALMLLATAAALVKWKKSMRYLAAFLLSLAPVLWYVPPRTVSGWRLAYLPGVLLTLFLAHGLEEGGPTSPRSRVARLLASLPAPAIMLASALCIPSLYQQQQIWLKSFRIAEHAVIEFHRHVGHARTALITNLPWQFVEGPYILKPYAFKLFYRGQEVPHIRAKAVFLRYRHGDVVVERGDGGIYPEPDPLCTKAGEELITLDEAAWHTPKGMVDLARSERLLGR